jgi:hypothetical protein
MIAQSTDGLSRGTLSKGVVAGKDMLSFVNLSLLAVERHPPIVEFVQSWVGLAIGKGQVLKSEEWFVEGHGDWFSSCVVQLCTGLSQKKIF